MIDESKSKLQSCIKIMRTLPPRKTLNNITALSNLIYDEDDLLNEFLQKVDSPAEICEEDSLGAFLKCEYNREGDSYRSPHTNKYFPALEDEEGRYPTSELRELEVNLNKIFKIYAKSYYSNHAISSVYVWELGNSIEDGFCVAVLIKNNVKDEKSVSGGIWDSSNLVNVSFSKENEKIRVNYKLTTSIHLQMDFTGKEVGNVDLSGTIAKQVQDSFISMEFLNNQFHANNIGTMIENMENNLRNILEELYIKKTKEIIDGIRVNPTLGRPNLEQANRLRDVFNSAGR